MQCVEGLVQAGTRQLLLFATETRNVGEIDWWLGKTLTNNPASSMRPATAITTSTGSCSTDCLTATTVNSSRPV